MTRIKVLSGAITALIVSAAIADTPATPATPATAPTPAPAAVSSAPAAEARIPFVNHGGIYNWQVLNDKTVLIQGLNRKWYKATLMSSCLDLPFAEQIGVESNADGSFDKFSSIKVRGRSCPLTSLVESAPPPRKVKASKAAASAPEAAAAPAAPAAPAQ